jgi:putative hemolysin
MRQEGTKLRLSVRVVVFVTALVLHGCSLGTEVGNGNKPRPSDNTTEAANTSVNPVGSGEESQSNNNPPKDSVAPASDGGNGGSSASTAPSNQQGGNASTPTVQMDNPADNYCIAKGGRLENRKDAQGNAYSLCFLPNGVTCESWAHFRGECPR